MKHTDSPRRGATVPDSRIVGLFLDRDETALTLTADKYGRLLRQSAFGILGDESDAEECLNDAYMALWNAIPPAQPAVLSSFAVKLIRRIAVNKYREKHRQKRVPAGLTVAPETLTEAEMPAANDADEWEARETGAVINEFVAGLPERQRYIFIGRFCLSEPVNRLAADLGITASAVYKELETMRKNLKQLLEERGIPI